MSGPVFLALRVALAISLYLFLAWAFVTLWQDLKRGSRSAAVRRAPPLTLIREIDGHAQPIRFDSPEILIGRDPASDLYLEDGTISARHARMSYHHGQWWVEDLNSTNGTFLNQEPVGAPLVLAGGDQLRFGQVEMRISMGESRQPNGRG